MARVLPLLLGLLALLVPGTASAQQFPPLTGRVVDAANVIPAEVEARLTQKLAGLETQSRRQLVIATVPDLQGYDIADYGYRLGRAWGIGSEARNDGALLIVAPKERKLRIEVGYGLEGVLTDGLSWIIINQTIVPRLKAGDMPGGIEAGTDALIRQLSLPDAEAQAAAAQAVAEAKRGDESVRLPLFIGLGLFFLVLFLLMGRGGRGRRYASGGPPVIVWGSGGDSGWSSGSGGGMFSGGGGSFGGGGASGDW